MSTIDELVESGELECLELELDDHELPHRVMFGTRRFRKWFSDELPKIEGADEDQLNCLEQFSVLLADFISGVPLQIGRRFHVLRPESNSIWELKTFSLRIFGWFAAKDVFVADTGGSADWIKRANAYAGYRDQTSRARVAMGLHETCITGKEYSDVLSDSDR